MNIAQIQFGYGTEIEDKISLNIYFSGCHDNKLCDRNKCHNPELHNFNYGYSAKDFINKIKKTVRSEIVECIVFLGGDPFDQKLLSLIELLNNIDTNKPIYAYTGYTKDQLVELKKEYLIAINFTNICYGEFKEGENNKKWFYIK